jgi:hypothetical protein
LLTRLPQSQKLHLSYWDTLIREYFTPKAIMKLTLWRDSMKNEAKPFGAFHAVLAAHQSDLTQKSVSPFSPDFSW